MRAEIQRKQTSPACFYRDRKLGDKTAGVLLIYKITHMPGSQKKRRGMERMLHGTLRTHRTHLNGKCPPPEAAGGLPGREQTFSLEVLSELGEGTTGPSEQPRLGRGVCTGASDNTQSGAAEWPTGLRGQLLISAWVMVGGGGCGIEPLLGFALSMECGIFLSSSAPLPAHTCVHPCSLSLRHALSQIDDRYIDR